ncbi:MAG: ABC transporter ATP-binding protein [Planctomycetota bacterium]
MTAPAIELRDLGKAFPNGKGEPPRHALRDVSFAVHPGEVVGVLGANGSGKTTLFRILATLLRPTSGAATLHGIDLAQDPAAVRRSIGVVLQAGGLDTRMTVAEHLRLFAKLKGLRAAEAANATAQAAQDAGLQERLGTQAGQLSGGMQRRLELAAACLGSPPILLLDEAAVGLDADARAGWWLRLREMASSRGTAVLATTHQLDEADRCDRLVLLDQGALRAQGPPGVLRADLGEQVLRVRPARASLERVRNVLTPLANEQADTQLHTGRGVVVVEGAGAAALIAPSSQELGGDGAEFILGPPTLEDLVRHHAGPADAGATHGGTRVDADATNDLQPAAAKQ